LGAEVEAPRAKSKKYIKPGESREDSEPKVLAPSADGHTRHTKGLDEKLIPLSKVGLNVGSFVSIVSGPHDGLFAWIVNFVGKDTVIVRLEASDEHAEVPRSDLTLADEKKMGNGEATTAQTDSTSSGRDHEQEKNNSFQLQQVVFEEWQQQQQSFRKQEQREILAVSWTCRSDYQQKFCRWEILLEERCDYGRDLKQRVYGTAAGDWQTC